MKTIRFNKTECGVDFLINVLNGSSVVQAYAERDVYNTDMFEILFFRNANGYLHLDGHKIPVVNNTVVFLSPYQRRKWQLDNNLFDFDVVVFQEDFLNEFFSDKWLTYKLLYFYQYSFPPILSIAASDMLRYNMVLEEIKEELTFTSPGASHIIRSQLYYLLMRLNRSYSSYYSLPFVKADNNYAYVFKQLMEQNIYTKQRVSEYADMMNISRVTLNNSVKDVFNVSAVDLIKQRLVFEIKHYLLYSQKSVAEIATILNFSEPNHLIRFFKTQTGYTTTQFLIAYQNGMLA